MNNLNDKPEPKESRDPLSIVYLLACGHALCVLVFMRHSFGTQAFGKAGLVSLVMIVAYGSFAQSYAMWPFLGVWFAAVAVQRIITWFKWQRGWVEHSRYSGWPGLALRFPFVRRETTAKTLIEPLLCFVVGFFLLPLWDRLGLFIMAGMLSLIVKASMERSMERVRVRQMRDAAFDQKNLAAMYRGQDAQW